jgi:hypothetical protein
MKYGFYSEEAAKRCPVYIYRTSDGREVRATGLSTVPTGDDYMWKDKICVGVVSEYVRTISNHTDSMIKMMSEMI